MAVIPVSYSNKCTLCHEQVSRIIIWFKAQTALHTRRIGARRCDTSIIWTPWYRRTQGVNPVKMSYEWWYYAHFSDGIRKDASVYDVVTCRPGTSVSLNKTRTLYPHLFCSLIWFFSSLLMMVLTMARPFTCSQPRVPLNNVCHFTYPLKPNFRFHSLSLSWLQYAHSQTHPLIVNCYLRIYPSAWHSFLPFRPATHIWSSFTFSFTINAFTYIHFYPIIVSTPSFLVQISPWRPILVNLVNPISAWSIRQIWQLNKLNFSWSWSMLFATQSQIWVYFVKTWIPNSSSIELNLI